MAILRIRQEDGTWVEIPAIVGSPGNSGVYVGTGDPPGNANVWINPNGDPTGTEEWEFDLEDGSTDSKQVVVLNSEESSGKLAVLRFRQADGTWTDIPAIKGDPGPAGYTPVKGKDYFDGGKGDPGDSGVYIGTGIPPANANVWVNPTGEPTSTEDWEFDMDDGSTDTKQVVVLNSDEATANGMLGILKVKQEDGTWKEIPALVGGKGDKGDTGEVDYSRLNNYLPLAGGAMTGGLSLAGDPVTNMQASTKQYVDNEIAGLSIGGRNLFRNTTTFEGWSLASNITAQDGIITWAATSALGWNAITNRDAAVKYSEIRDKEVTVSFEVRCAEYAKLNNEPNNGLIANLALFKPGVGSRHAYADVNYFKHTLSDKWERIEYTFVASDSFFAFGGGVIDPENDNFVIGLYNYSLYSMQIRNVKLERGNKATDWTLAPEDIALRSDNAPVTVTSTDGVAYTATAPSITAKNLTELKGAKLVIIPNMTSTSATSVTLNINGLGAKAIKRWDNLVTSEWWSFQSPGWFKAGYPVTVTFNGTYWMIEGMNKPYASDLQGAVPIEKGGTGATTAADARTNLGLKTETWTFKLRDGSTVTKVVHIG